MAIGIAAKALAKKLLKNKSLKKAINVTTKQTNKLKEAVKVNTKKVTGSAAVTGAVAKAKPAVKKAVDKTKDAVAKVKEKAKPAVDKAKETARAASVKARRKAGPKVRDTAKRVARGTAAATGGALGLAGGMAAAPTLGGAVLGATTGFVSAKDPIKGAKIGAGVGGALGLAATGALAASMLKSSTPKEAAVEIKKDSNGSYVTRFKDDNNNLFASTKQISGKDLDEVRRGIAILDSILLSEDPRKQQRQFSQIAAYLNLKHGITTIQGKNLNIVMPQGLNERGNKNMLISSPRF
mgnify:CR=1 FL=1|tara:strand:+ start:3939 stop:4823 length:885 start_codon:yes stop_codon:yes gene_type:complete